MRRLWALVAMLALGAFMLTPPAFADGSLDTIVSSLNKSSVYVESGVPGTDVNTAAQLSTELTSGDQLKLVMVKSANDYGAADATALAEQLNKALDGKGIVAVSSGDTMAVATSIMPIAVANDLMHRAASVSSSNPETLVTFVRNVHSWQAAHPQPKPAAPNQTVSAVAVLVLFTVAGIALILAAVGLVREKLRSGRNQSDDISLKKSPDVIKVHLQRLLELRLQVRDTALRNTIGQCVTDIEAYFAKFSSNPEADKVRFGKTLDSVAQVLEKYVEIQDSPSRYYVHAAEEMASGKKSVTDYAESVIKSIQRGSTSGLVEYNVNKQILQAQRYR